MFVTGFSKSLFANYFDTFSFRRRCRSELDGLAEGTKYLTEGQFPVLGAFIMVGLRLICSSTYKKFIPRLYTGRTTDNSGFGATVAGEKWGRELRAPGLGLFEGFFFGFVVRGMLIEQTHELMSGGRYSHPIFANDFLSGQLSSVQLFIRMTILAQG